MIDVTASALTPVAKTLTSISNSTATTSVVVMSSVTISNHFTSLGLTKTAGSVISVAVSTTGLSSASASAAGADKASEANSHNILGLLVFAEGLVGLCFASYF